MSRLALAFARARAEKRAAFIAYLCAGDPDFDTSLAACRALIGAGIDILELGVPFSDPLADGLTNQLAAQRALESGMTSARVFELVRRLREHSEIPIVFYTYYNLVFANGVAAYVRAARAAGVDGMLTLDLPPEEAGELLGPARAAGLETICLVAPTTPEARLPDVGVDAVREHEVVVGVEHDRHAARLPHPPCKLEHPGGGHPRLERPLGGELVGEAVGQRVREGHPELQDVASRAHHGKARGERRVKIRITRAEIRDEGRPVLRGGAGEGVFDP